MQGGTLVFQLTVSGEGGLESTDVISVEIYTGVLVLLPNHRVLRQPATQPRP